ncbi:MAG: alpha/beta hydrolase [Breznakibacter sp.]
MKTLFISMGLLFGSLASMAQTDGNQIFVEDEVVLQTGTGEISGTLTVPVRPGVSTVVLIVAGSGPTDRNCNSPQGIHTNAYKMLAEGFAMHGIASLRYDKRGIGKSQSAGIKESDLRFDDYVDDVAGWVSFLKGDKRFAKVVLLGHSEGSLLCILAAQRAGVAGVVSVAGAGRGIDRILREQLRPKLPAELFAQAGNVIDSLLQERTVASVNPMLAALFRASVQPYLISWMKYDPAVEIAKLSVPTLIVQGTLDMQVPVEDAKLLSAAKPGATLLMFENMNHVLKECDKEPASNLATYRQPDLPLQEGLVDAIAGFLKSIG